MDTDKEFNELLDRLFHEALHKLELLDGYDTRSIEIQHDHGLIDTLTFYEEVMKLE